MFRFFYNLLFPLAFALSLPVYLQRMVRRGNYRENFGQRLGWYRPEVVRRLAAQKGTVWLQAVSVGEMLVALKLLAGLRAQAPALPIVLSTTTTTGYALARERAPAGVEVLYTPIDLKGAVRRAFAAIKPAQLVIVDGGLWPNQLWEAAQRRVPTALVNARLSPRSERRFRRFPRLAAALYGQLGLVGVAGDNDLVRWSQLGVAEAALRHTGSVKFDEESAEVQDGDKNRKCALLAMLGVTESTPILLAGSTHAGEERALAEIFLRLRRQFPNLALLIAPRHVERTSEVKTELEALGLSVVLRTALPTLPPPNDSPTVLLIDTTGELRGWYPLATLVFIGKSLRAHGGQNPAEAITAGVPVIVGPHMENFEDLITKLLDADAVVQIGSAEALEAQCARLLADPGERKRLAKAAREQVTMHRGATARTARFLLEQLRNSACQGT